MSTLTSAPDDVEASLQDLYDIFARLNARLERFDQRIASLEKIPPPIAKAPSASLSAPAAPKPS